MIRLRNMTRDERPSWRNNLASERRAFVQMFVRPHGLDRPAADVAAERVLTTALEWR